MLSNLPRKNWLYALLAYIAPLQAKSTTLISSKHIEFLLGFDNEILEKWKQQTKDPIKKRIFEQAQISFRESGEIDENAKKLIQETIGPLPINVAKRFEKVHAIVLQRLSTYDKEDTKDNLSLEWQYEQSVCHELLPKKILYKTFPKKVAYITLHVQPRTSIRSTFEQWQQAQRKTKTQDHWMPLKAFFALRNKTSEEKMAPMIQDIEDYLECEDNDEKEAKLKEIKQKYNAKHHLGRPVFDYIAGKFPRKGHIQIRKNTVTQKEEPHILLEMHTEKYIIPQGKQLFITVQRPKKGKKEKSLRLGYKNRTIDLLRPQQQGEEDRYVLTAYFFKTPNEQQTAQDEHGCYQLYDEEENKYVYYHLGPRGKTEISFRQFLRNSHLATLLVYKYYDTYEQSIPVQLISEKGSFAIRSAIEGILVAILAWTLLASTFEPDNNQESRNWRQNLNPFTKFNNELNTPLNSGGLYNFKAGLNSVCWYNSHFQMFTYTDRDLLVNTQYKELNMANQNLMEKLSSAMNGGEGPTVYDIYWARDELSNAGEKAQDVYRDNPILPRTSGQQMDGSELLDFLAPVNELEEKQAFNTINFLSLRRFNGLEVNHKNANIEKVINAFNHRLGQSAKVISYPYKTLPITQHEDIEMQELIDKVFDQLEDSDAGLYIPVSELEGILKIKNNKSWKVAKKDLMTFLTWKKEIKEALEKLHNEEELPYQPYKLIDKLIKDMPQ
ncbi:MAG: hypothetical protein AAF335_04590, partial [Bacteroidota bacterium]